MFDFLSVFVTDSIKSAHSCSGSFVSINFEGFLSLKSVPKLFKWALCFERSIELIFAGIIWFYFGLFVIILWICIGLVMRRLLRTWFWGKRSCLQVIWRFRVIWGVWNGFRLIFVSGMMIHQIEKFWNHSEMGLRRLRKERWNGNC